MYWHSSKHFTCVVYLSSFHSPNNSLMEMILVFLFYSKKTEIRGVNYPGPYQIVSERTCSNTTTRNHYTTDIKQMMDVRV